MGRSLRARGSKDFQRGWRDDVSGEEATAALSRRLPRLLGGGGGGEEDAAGPTNFFPNNLDFVTSYITARRGFESAERIKH